MKPVNALQKALVPCPADIDPEHLRTATSRLITHVSDQVDATGAIRGACHSRVLESALALTLLTRTGAAPPARRRVLAYLQEHLGSAQEFDRVIATLAVGRATGRASAGDADIVDKLTGALLGAAPAFIAARRRRMLHAVLSLLGCPVPPDTGPAADEQAPTDPAHSWSAVQQAAVTLVLAHTTGVHNAATAAALRTLTAVHPETAVWEGYVLLHLLALHALAGVPGQDETVRGGVRTLLRHQRDDGGFPFVTDLQHWCSATAGLALTAAGAPPDVPQAMARALAAHAPDPARRALCRSLSRGTPLADGWSFGPRVAQNDVDCTSCALEFLQTVDPAAHAGAVQRGVRGLLAVQGADGGFPTYVAGAASEPCMTAAAVNALAPHPSTGPARTRALRFLADSQLPDGGFEPGWSRSRLHAMFRARLAACAAPPDDHRTARMAERIERSARETQNTDGGWGMRPGDPSDDISTAYGLITLCYGTESRPVGRALTWLLAHQNPDGGYSGPPDMVGPRPFPYHIPVLTDAPVLLALGHVRHRVRGTASLLRYAA
ncbi:terpene cyclase/mutase family protein [Streptomyces roseirectus]|uniref:Terpene cyclase/mutase family protein n=1 Tax=Streptomyces roseirectus TaxID=2768066 RepID=A0A7H0IPL2_9ACTN|nr:prenyltransferase/squalene oxidase repeat-containing protein [Streptomyces roseirectus]QNP74728.1 terpene cyclase/mutase family protein [Streptomyces roseirectus]